MNKNKILSGGGKNLTGGGKWGWRGREVGGEGEGSGVRGGGKWGERGGKWGLGTPLSTPSVYSISVLTHNSNEYVHIACRKYTRATVHEMLEYIALASCFSSDELVYPQSHLNLCCSHTQSRGVDEESG